MNWQQLHRLIGRYTLVHSLYLIPALLFTGGCAPSSSNDQSADPVVVDFPIAYVKRTLPSDEDGNLVPVDLREPTEFNPGAELFFRDRAAPSSAATSITAGVFPDGELYDVKDLEPSFDGSRLLFAMRAPEIENADEDEQPTWNIWEYDFTDSSLRQVIPTEISARAGQDFAPHYLPDGRIVFSSTRQRTGKAKLLDDGKPQYSALDEDRDTEAAVLHVMDSDGQNINQISFNQSHDLDPIVLDDGRIAFSRWDNMGNRNRISLYSVAPDGRDLQFLYGVHSHDTGTDGSTIEFVENRSMEDGRIMIVGQPARSTQYGGDLIAVDVENFTEIDQTTFSNTGDTNPGQESLTLGDVATDNSLSLNGRYADAFPLHDGSDRAIISYSPCRIDISADPENPDIRPCTQTLLDDPNAVTADPLYGIWVADLIAGTQLPVVVAEEGFMHHDVVTLAPRTEPSVIIDGEAGVDLDTQLVSEDVGVLHIRSVYDLDGNDTANPNIATLADPIMTPTDQRPARFLRVVKAVSIPDDDIVDFDNSAFGRSTQQLMREILGYTPIEPDGSVKVKIPANVPFALSILDAEGKRIGGRHQNWLQLRPGEEANCTGCHTANSELPHGRESAQAPSAYLGALGNGVAFPNTEPSLSPDLGESMAETYARINGPRELTADIFYDDDWTDPAVQAKSASFSFEYSGLQSTAPETINCLPQWNANCRIVIHYPNNIQPMWETARVDPADGVSDVTCISCHAATDAMATPQVPAAQINLAGTPSIDETNHAVSYRELFFSGPEQDEQELNADGVLVYRLVPVLDANGDQVFQTDQNGDLILDNDGNPIPVPDVRVSVPAPMNVNSAAANNDFVTLFTSGSHAGWLNSSELKLIYEWLDIGGQYFNDPFDAPLDN